MNCIWCKQECLQFEWDETSHLGRRPICHTCLGERDLCKMRRTKTAILILSDNRLYNASKSLSFNIRDKIIGVAVDHYVFLVDKKRWAGISFKNCNDNRVMCRKQ